ncbi:meiosis-specific protein MEI4-like [Oculina patagonica]
MNNIDKSYMEDIYLYQYIKMALAITVIKRKPSDISVKTYLKELLKNVQLQDGNWSKKVAEWEKLFQQRQQEWMSVLLSKTDLDKGVEPSSSHCGNELTSRFQTHERNMHLLKNVSFQCKTVQDPVGFVKEDYTVLQNTLLGAIEFLTLATQQSKETLPFPKQLYLACINKTQEIRFTTDSHSEVKTKMEQMVDCLIKCLLQWKNASLRVVSTEIRDILLSVGSSALLRDVCLLRLTWHIRAFAASLQLVAKGELEFSSKVMAYQNIFCVLLVLEELLKETFLMSHSSETVPSIYHQLSGSLLHISQAYPVVSYYLWRLQVLLMRLPSFSEAQDKTDLNS